MDWSAVIVGVVTALSGIVSAILASRKNNIQTNCKMEELTKLTNAKFESITDITNYKIEQLTKEVEYHNNFAKRMPVVEEQIKVINHRIADLEEK